MKNDWSIKSMIREIATSRTYRISSQFDLAAYERDPENTLLWRASPRRLEAEAIRDSMLKLAGKLDLHRPSGSEVARGGSGVARNGQLAGVRSRLDQIKGEASMSSSRMQASQSMRGPSRRYRNRSRTADRVSPPSSDPKAYYRSVYLPVVRDSFPRSLSVFDFAESSMVVGRRETSNTPDQGLFFLNNLLQFLLQPNRLINEPLQRHFAFLELGDLAPLPPLARERRARSACRH